MILKLKMVDMYFYSTICEVKFKANCKVWNLEKQKVNITCRLDFACGNYVPFY